MARADMVLLEALHNATAAQLLDYITNGYPSVDAEGVEHRGPIPAAVLAQAIKFLKDNGVEAVPVSTSPLGELERKLIPQFNEDDGEFAEDLPVRAH